MGFSKEKRDPDVTIVVRYFGETYEFTFPKILPQSALEAEQKFLGAKTDEERPDAAREGLIELVAQMVTREPTGFDDFPQPQQGTIEPLSDRMREYFDDPAHPELEAILVSAWKGYKVAALPSSFLKVVQDSGASGSDLPGATSKA